MPDRDSAYLAGGGGSGAGTALGSGTREGPGRVEKVERQGLVAQQAARGVTEVPGQWEAAGR